MSKKILTLDNVPVINKKIGKIDTIEKLKASTIYSLGDIVDLNGYYTAGDGAHHKRKIESADDGSGVQLANGLWANIVHSGEVNVSWFGAKGDGVFLNGDIFIKASNYVCSKNLKLRVGIGSFLIEKTIDLSDMPYPQNLENAYFSTFKLEGASMNQSNLIGDIGLERMFVQNKTSQYRRMEIQNIYITSKEPFDDLTKRANLKAFKCIGTPNSRYKNIRALGITQIIETDSCWFSEFENIASNRCRSGILVGSDGIRDIGQADSCNFKDIQVGGWTNDFGLKLVGMHNCLIEALDFEAGYTGNGLIVEACRSIDINSVYIENFNSVTPIVVKGFDKATHQYHFSTDITIRNIRAYNIQNLALVLVKDFVENITVVNASVQNSNVNSVTNLFHISKTTQNERLGFSIRGLKYVGDGRSSDLFSAPFLTGAFSHVFINKNTQVLDNNKNYYSPFVCSGDSIVDRNGSNKMTCKTTGIFTNVIPPGKVTTTNDSNKATVTSITDLYVNTPININNTTFYIVEISTNEIRLDKKATFSGTYDISYKAPTFFESAFVSLDTPYYTLKMQQEGVYEDYVAYRDELFEYENSQVADETMLLQTLHEPEVPESVKAFAEKYKLI